MLHPLILSSTSPYFVAAITLVNRLVIREEIMLFYIVLSSPRPADLHLPHPLSVSAGNYIYVQYYRQDIYFFYLIILFFALISYI